MLNITPLTGFGATCFGDYWLGRISTGNIRSISVLNDFVSLAVAPPSGTYQMVAITTNRMGSISWQQRSSSGTLNTKSVDVASDNSVYLCGHLDNTLINPVSEKYNSSGTLQWSKYITTDGYTARNTYVDASGNVYLACYGGTVVWLIKLTSTPSVAWDRYTTFGSSGSLIGVIADSSGNVYISGYGDNTGSATLPILAKFNSSGTIQFQVSVTTTGITYTDIALDTTESNIYVTASDGTNGWLLKYNTSGTIQWQKSFTSCKMCGVVVDEAGDVFAVGAKTTSSVLFKLDASGNVIWQRELTSIIDEANDVKPISVDSLAVYICGGDIVAKLPKDGTGIGVYDGETYSVGTVTVASSTLTASTRTDSYASASPSLANTALSHTTASYAITTTKLPV